ncbi:MAG: DUF1501 domain-containing protein [Planctomycetes bacterium]|nr:DUF1501 domain-containing protein [Planctomycetota bacterium]
MNSTNHDRSTRRALLGRGLGALGCSPLASLLGTSGGRPLAAGPTVDDGAPGPHFVPRARHVIYLHMVGGPSQIDLFDHKPRLHEWYDKDLPESVRGGQRLTTMTSGQTRFPIAPSKFTFTRRGQCGMWINDLLPHLGQVADRICWMRSLYTEAINHEPAMSQMQTGNQVTGRPCLGAWASWGLGTLNRNLPAFVVMVATPSNREQEQAISGRVWSSGFLPGIHAGVSFRAQGDPILFLNNPAGVSSAARRITLDGIGEMNRIAAEEFGDPETQTRIGQYEMAYRMQSSVPELTAIDQEPASTYRLYGEDARKPGTFANSALLARRLVERGVRFVQIYHNNWDHHGNVAGRMPSQCRDVDQACAGLIRDLGQRGLLDDTLVIWGGEFGRTVYSQGGVGKDNYGRDHHPRCFTMWMAGGGVRAGHIHGETDDFSYNIVRDPIHIRDFHATILHQLGFDHQRMTYRHQGLDARLTGVEKARVITELLA